MYHNSERSILGAITQKEENIMKISSKWIVLITALTTMIALFSVSAYAQSPAGDLKPTFITLTPGLYVHGWPAFTVSYPKEWVVTPPPPGAFFKVGAARQDLSPSPQLTVTVVTSILPLEDWAKMYMPVYSQVGTDIKVLSEKPSQLKDGTPAREVELEFVGKNGPKLNNLILMTKKGAVWISVTLMDDKGKIGEDLKNYAYSLTFQPSREEPVKVPPDVRVFLNKWASDLASGDMERIMSNFSDQYLNNGMKKSPQEQYFRSAPLSPVVLGFSSMEITITVIETQGDKIYLAGFVVGKDKGGPFVNPLVLQYLTKENGQWKWYGNQK
jgi:hypothetical protein